MATRKSPPPPQQALLTPAKMRAAIARLEQRIADIRALDVSTIQSRDDQRIKKLESTIESTVASIYGARTHQYYQLSDAFIIDRAPHVVDSDFPLVAGRRRSGISLEELQEGIRRGCEGAITLLEGAVENLREELQHSEPTPDIASQSASNANPLHVFVVHGHDNAAKEQVARFLMNAGLKPIILHEQPSSGRTVIEKLEHYSDVGFAVVALTPDDMGASMGGDPQPRARQNVIAELFYFIGKFGRDRVCALLKGQIEIPSDIGGVVYVPFDDRGAWKTDLLKELAAAEYKLDWQKALT